MDDILFLKKKIDLLKSFSYTQAYTGELGNLKQKSYVLYTDIITKINEFETEIKKIQKQNEY